MPVRNKHQQRAPPIPPSTPLLSPFLPPRVQQRVQTSTDHHLAPLSSLVQTTERLSLISRLTNLHNMPPNLRSPTFANWLPTIRHLELNFPLLLSYDFASNPILLLPTSVSLKHLSIALPLLSSALAVFPTSLKTLRARQSYEDSSIDGNRLRLLENIGRFPLDQLEVLYFAEQELDPREMSTPLYEVIESAKTRGIEVQGEVR